MIERIIINNFKQFKKLDITCNKEKNILIGENGEGKSTILQAISLVLSGSFSHIESIGIINLFNVNSITDFFKNKSNDELPEVVIELYFFDSHFNKSTEFNLEGKHNSLRSEKFGLKLHIYPDENHIDEILTALNKNKWTIFPFEFYKVEFLTFSGKSYNSYSKPFKFSYSFINTSLIDTNFEMQKRINEIYEDNVESNNHNIINHKFRENSEEFFNELLSNNLLKNDGVYKLAFDNSCEDAFRSKMTVKKDNIDIHNLGQGEKVILSIENAYNRLSEKVKIVLIEEPENHLSHTNMLKLIDIFKQKDIQVFISTHSNMITSRLGINNCLLLNGGNILPIKYVDNDTVRFFEKSTNQNLLNFILCNKIILVEGNAEYILLEELYKQKTGNTTHQDNIQIISVDGLSFKRYLNIAKHFPSKRVSIITDNDKDYIKNIVNKYIDYSSIENIDIFSDPDINNYTFEICIYNRNQSILEGITSSTDVLNFMLNNKAEFSLRVLEKLCDNKINFVIPEYIEDAIEWVRKD
jgi:recF/recN/SMC N domain protein